MTNWHEEPPLAVDGRAGAAQGGGIRSRLQEKDTPSIHDYFTTLLSTLPDYYNLAYMAPDGAARVSGFPMKSRVNSSYLDWFRLMQVRRDSSLGGFKVGREGRPVYGC